MLVGEVLHGFQLNKDLVEAKQIGDVGLLQPMTMVEKNQFPLGLEGDGSGAQLDFHAFLIYRFDKSMTLLAVNLESRSHDLIHLILEWNVHAGLRKDFQPRIFTNFHEWKRGAHSLREWSGKPKTSASELARVFA
jgi:hypothetical protein